MDIDALPRNKFEHIVVLKYAFWHYNITVNIGCEWYY
jgi:hypothetical protein